MVAALVALVISGGVGAASPSQARPFWPNSIDFWDTTHGLLSSGGGAWCLACDSGTIQTTTDGGRTWRIRYRSRDPITTITVAGRSAVWAVVERCTSSGTCRPHTLLHSADRGLSWRVVPSVRVGGVSFATARTGLALDARSRPLLRTTDGGRTWRRLPSPCRGGGGDTLQSVSLTSSRRGWALCVGQPGAGNQAKSILETYDGGFTWRLRAAVAIGGPGGAGLDSYGYAQGIQFLSSGTGILWESRGVLLFTHSDGRAWRRAPVVRPERDYGQSATVVSSRTFFALLTGPHRRLVVTRDGGAHWRTVHRWG